MAVSRLLRLNLTSVAVIAAVVALVAACSTPSTAGRPEAGAIRVVATTTVLADLVAQVGGSKADVASLVPAGGEVHTFDPSPNDVAALADAQLVFMNGLGLDEWAMDLIEGSGSHATVVELGEDLEGVEYLADDEAEGEAPPGASQEPSHGHNGSNPHLWLNVAYARLYVDRIAEALAAADPDDAQTYTTNHGRLAGELDRLHATIADRMAAIPAENRRIVSFHEAFPYFAAAYGLEIVGVVVDAPGQDPSAGEVAALIEAIKASGARAVFSEAQFNDQLARVIAAEAGVRIESGLHNDSIGDPPADSYVGMMEANLAKIEAALR